MKDVFVCHSNEDKSIAKKLVSKLESSGISCFVFSRDKNSGDEEVLIADSNIFIFILSESAQNSETVIRQIKYAVENNCHIIPFKIGKTDNSLSTQYLLYSLEWVDALSDGFDEAYEILLEIIEELSEGKPIVKTPKKRNTGSNEGFKLQKSHLAVIIALFSLIIIYLVFFNDKTESQDLNNINNNSAINNVDPPDYVNSDLKEDEKILVGSWRMVDYEDSRVMSPEEQALTAQNIQEMKKRVLLKYNADRTFERVGFTEQVQKGYWEFNSEENKIYLTPENVNQKEIVNILNISDSQMTIFVTEVIKDPQGRTETVTTKISFRKQ